MQSVKCAATWSHLEFARIYGTCSGSLFFILTIITASGSQIIITALAHIASLKSHFSAKCISVMIRSFLVK